MAVITIRNQVLDINPPAGEQHLSENGSDWLWAVCSLFGLAFVSVHRARTKLELWRTGANKFP
jgi:bacteriorhodopsin